MNLTRRNWFGGALLSLLLHLLLMAVAWNALQQARRRSAPLIYHVDLVRAPQLRPRPVNKPRERVVKPRPVTPPQPKPRPKPKETQAPPRHRPQAKPLPRSEPEPAVEPPKPTPKPPEEPVEKRPEPTPAPAVASTPEVQAPAAATAKSAAATPVRIEGDVRISDAYLQQIVARINRQWETVPRAGKQRAVVYFTILRNGSVSGLKLEQPAASRAFNRAAQNAVRRVGRFQPLPPSVRDPWLGVHFEFQQGE